MAAMLPDNSASAMPNTTVTMSFFLFMGRRVSTRVPGAVGADGAGAIVMAMASISFSTA